MKKILICLPIILTISFSCKKNNNILLAQKNKNDTIMINDSKLIEKVLKNQLVHGYGLKEDGLDIFSNYEYGLEDFEVNQEISNQILLNNSYKTPSSDEFEKKIKEVFKFNSNKNLINFLIEYPCTKDKVIYQADGNYVISNNNPLFIDINKKMITEALFIPELLDYKKKFPNLAKDEDNLPTTIKDNKGLTLNLIKWKDFSDLKEIRDQKTQTLINRNKFLFNDNKASFAWLQFNDKLFLESLIKTFGYVSNKDLLDWYLKRNGIEKFNGNISEYLRVFYLKNCDDSFIINKKTFEYMDSKPEKYSREILTVLDGIKTQNVNLENLKFEERVQLIAYLLYFGEKHKEKTGLTFAFMGAFYEYSSDNLQKKYDDEFKKNNFYGLPNFEKFWSEAKLQGDGIGLDM